jgi:hypothetical protein
MLMFKAYSKLGFISAENIYPERLSNYSYIFFRMIKNKAQLVKVGL